MMLDRVGGVGNLNFSVFDRDKWRLRLLEEHREVGNRLLACEPRMAGQKLSPTLVTATLLMLPYFSPTRMLVIDPMLNFWGDTAKHF